jgi:hypothetical protein
MSRRPSLDDTSLAESLHALVEDEARVAPGPQLEARVMAAWDRAHVRPRRVPLALLASAAALTLATIAAAQWALRGAPAALPAPPVRAAVAEGALALPMAAVPAADAERGADSQTSRSPRRQPEPAPVTFVVVGEPLAAGEAVQVVRMRVNADRLAAFGLQPVPRADSVDVELLVGEDGIARGLRLRREME